MAQCPISAHPNVGQNFLGWDELSRQRTEARAAGRAFPAAPDNGDQYSFWIRSSRAFQASGTLLVLSAPLGENSSWLSLFVS